MASAQSTNQYDNDALLKQLGGAAGSIIDKGPVFDKGQTGATAGDVLDSGARGTQAATSNTMPIAGGEARNTAADTVGGNDEAHWNDSRNFLNPTNQVFQGFQPKYAMEGIDWNREQNIGKSAKDAYAYFANNAPEPPPVDKAALGEWFNKYIAPGMNQLGHNVSNVQGDTFHLKNWQGDFDVDWNRGAGAEGNALAWQVQEPTARLSNAAYTPQQVARPPAALATTQTNSSAGADDPQAQLKQEIDALIAGGASPLDTQALLAQLQGGQ